MKKFCIVFVIVAIIILTGIGLIFPKENKSVEYLRIHIRANSNLQADQSVKYQVKQAVVDYLTPFIADCTTKSMAEQMVKENLLGIEQVANGVLKQNGFNYNSSAKINNESFPTRVYDGVVLDSGYYDALIINLGSGEGDNWWCVVYPPLCFTGEGTNYQYKSKILGIINDFFYKKR